MIFKKFAAVTLALLAFNTLFFNHFFPTSGTLGFLLLILTMQATIWISFYTNLHTKKNKLAFASAIISFAVTFLSIFRANEIDRTLLSSLSVALSFSTLYLLSLSHNDFGAISELVNIPWKIFTGWFTSFLETIKGSYNFFSKSTKSIYKIIPKKRISNRNLVVIFRGLVITIPIVSIVLILLSIADPIFSKLITSVFTFSIDIKIPHLLISVPKRLIYSLIFLAAIIPLVILKIDSKFVSPLQNKSFGKYKGEMIILISALVLVLGAFLLIQFKYLFATVEETQLHQFGVQTYSAYVRRGFVEMTLVSIIVYFISVVSLLVHRVNKSNKDWLKKLNIILLFEMMVFIFSVFRRVVLYQTEHGLTRIRVYGTMFLIMIIGLTIILWLRQIKTNFKNWYLYEIGVVIAIILTTSLINVDNLIATIFQPTVNKEIDYTYISKLSADGLEGWEQVWENLQLSKNLYSNTNTINLESRNITYDYFAITNFKKNYETLIAKYGTDEENRIAGTSNISNQSSWYEKNFSEFQAYKKLTTQIPYIEVLDDYNYFLSLWDSLLIEDKQQNLDRSRNTPLL